MVGLVSGPDSLRAFRLQRFAFIGIAALLLAPVADASDHADPISLDRLEGGITDLFVFPAKDMVRRVKDQDSKEPKQNRAVTSKEGNRLVIVFCVRRALSSSPPFTELGRFTYHIHADLHSANEVSFQKDDPNFARYGGTVKSPEGIDPDFTISIQLDNMANYQKKEVMIKEGNEWKRPKMADAITWYSGVRDDPFIFPMFFGTNVIAMVISIPFDCFPGGQKDFLFWATSHDRGTQIDHVGRSQRTQLPRFDLLNSLPPKEHVAALRNKDKDPGLIDDFLRVKIRPVFNLRFYDYQPDVMFYNRRADATYPNGRQLEDDVAELTCKQGDCQLYELSFLPDPKYAPTGGRPTKNDKEFLDEFPFLAEPWPDKIEAPPPELTAKNQIVVVALITGIVLFVLLPWVLYFWVLRRLRATNRQLDALRRPQPASPPAPSAPPHGP